MPDLKITLFLLLSSLPLSGCVSQRYVGVQITSTQPASLTRVLINGNAVVLCRVGDEARHQLMREKQ
ncbi:hypothetical protein DEO48_08345 [Enterobacter sp. CGMCC 5087]|uniref:hypothetical protein n=1 Tax=Enterobacter sp. CGMCC 5087 TaxID=2183878 RepID=UPI000D683E06|nr:hypothetical protein [Enterobacter sp. CGMCC 5087]PWI80495.1 hypothetical protein DEO48_08345 [Enterobacter sp. CGMCC 5087]